MTVVKLPKMSEDEINEVLRTKNICRIAFIDGNFPYISPFQYVYHNNTLYFHFTDYGKKIRILKENSNVCVSIEHFENDLSSYFFISIQGKLILVQSFNEKSEVLNKMINKMKEKFSTNFLIAHGFNKEHGWEGFVMDNQLIYKLEPINEPIALKSRKE